MVRSSVKIAIIAGEESGDFLGGDLIRALKNIVPIPITLVGVGGNSLKKEGLVSLFDISEISVMGITSVIKRLPRLLFLIHKTIQAIVSAKPDLLIIVDSPDFTHRVAKGVRNKLPVLPIINYVCPSVWAWRQERARKMISYIDHILALFPFEPEVMYKLKGPVTTFIGHPLSSCSDVIRVGNRQEDKKISNCSNKRILLLPGSRTKEIVNILPVFRETMNFLLERNASLSFGLVTIPSREQLLRRMILSWDKKPEIIVGRKEEKWQAFAEADAALATSGTVVFELALCSIPVVSVYKLDWIVNVLNLSKYITTWTCALPNLIIDYPAIPEYFNEAIRYGALARWMEELTCDTLQRQAMLASFRVLQNRIKTSMPAGEIGAGVILDIFRKNKII
ncbi:Lipid-A-disaccharide synthase [Liberibacter crescens BT-1]|uniref:Lipid-A-disaccharide synthase n=1 Tax=Liberibacter crescens (strain BT-1) TaxID=1215343 RepID=L0ETA3_LIBCB|nr:lipid-A-disaccharide synthase [Liberibacter crescens]AGA64045.1 Lipid-A-disaccharide synthase [Liberibacter crescens BT-1]AMC12349.1 lipid-A-disaccharide synthase [Liberibacter crescens]